MFGNGPLVTFRRALKRASNVIALSGAVFAVDPAMAANLEGVWQLSAPQSTLAPVDGKPVPFTPAGRGRYEANSNAAAARDWSFDLTESRCSSPGVPRVMLAPTPMKIFQRPDMVTMMFAWNHVFRQIDLAPDKIKAIAPAMALPQIDIPTVMGKGIGRWDGATLTVKSNDFSGDKLLDNLLPSSEDLAVTEHIRLRDANTLEDRIDISDPQNFTHPWQTVLVYKRASDDLFPFKEDVCPDRLKAGQHPLFNMQLAATKTNGEMGMKPISKALCVGALCAAAVQPTISSAQTPPAGRPPAGAPSMSGMPPSGFPQLSRPAGQAPAGAPTGMPPMGPMYNSAPTPRPSFAETTRALNAAAGYAAKKSVSVACAVLDARGDPLGLIRMDGADFLTVNVAEGKALTSVIMHIPSGMAEAMSSELGDMSGLVHGTMVAKKGAVPVVRNKQVVGAIGCSGATAGAGALDEDIAKAGLAAMGIH